jgi:hypothetical protein
MGDMSDQKWRWPIVAVNVAVFMAIVAGLLYWADGATHLPTFATIGALVLIGVCCRWLSLEKLS